MKEKKYFSREQIETLKPADIHFFSCVYEKWKRGTMMSLNDLVADTYEQTTGEKLPRNWNCASCSFNNYLTIGKLYYESIEHWKEMDEKNGKQLEFDFKDDEPDEVQKETEPALNINELQDEVAETETNNAPEQPKKKPGRPKKNK
jgi:hypothetical protein